MPAKVLIVEDDKLTALGIAEVVTLAGYDVIGSVSSVSEAVDRACVVYPDIAVFDIRLAGRRDGVEGAAILKEMGGAKVVFVSAEQAGEPLERARAVQPVALLLKPCHPRDLLLQVLCYCQYNDLPVQLTPEALDRAVENYFTVVG